MGLLKNYYFLLFFTYFQYLGLHPPQYILLMLFPLLPTTGCVTLGKLLNFSMSPHLQNGDNNNTDTLSGCHVDPVRYYRECLEQFLIHAKLTIIVI